MATTAAEVEKALLLLNRADRTTVLHRGLLSLEPDLISIPADDQFDLEWQTALHERIAEVEEGQVELLDIDTSHAELRAELASRW